MKLEMSFYGHHSPGVVRAHCNEELDTFWIQGEEDSFVATMFIEPEQAKQIIEVLSKQVEKFETSQVATA